MHCNIRVGAIDGAIEGANVGANEGAPVCFWARA